MAAPVCNSNLLTREEVEEITRKDGQENVEVIRYGLKEKSEIRLGFLGDHYTLTVTTRHVQDNSTTTKTYFVKTFPKQQLMDEDFLGKTGLFKKETDMYQELLVTLREMSPMKFCPKYYLNKYDVLVLEDLSEQGFVVPAHTGILDLPHMKCVMSTLAALHAASLALEESAGSQPLDRLHPHLFNEILFDETKVDAPTRRWLMKGIEDLCVGVEHLKGYTEEEMGLICKKVREALLMVYPLSKRSDKYRNVIVHGDVWANNILFKYDASAPTAAILVDYQFARYAPPAHDVMHLLYLVAIKTFRESTEQLLLSYYHQELGAQLKLHGHDVEEVLPWGTFRESCEVYRELAVGQSLLSMNYVKAPAQEIPTFSSPQEHDAFVDLHRKEFVAKCFRDAAYRGRVVEIFNEFIDRYILKREV